MGRGGAVGIPFPPGWKVEGDSGVAMLDRPRLARRAWGLATLFGWTFLVMALAGFNPADPPGNSAWPANAPPANPCGPVGAWIAHLLYQAVGLGAWLLVLAAGSTAILIVRRRPVPDPLLRLVGLSLTTLVGAAVAQGASEWRGRSLLDRGPTVGDGGYLGAFAVAGLRGQFGVAGMVLILAALGLGGLALCHEVLLTWPLQDLLHPLLSRRRRQEPEPSPGLLPEPVHRPIPSPNFLVAEREGPRLAPTPTRAALERPVVSSGPGVPVRMSSPRPAPPPAPIDGSYLSPPLDLLEPAPPFPVQEHEAKLNTRALQLERTLLDHGCQVRVVQIDTGPVITQFEIELEAGLRVSKVAGLSNDLAIALAVPSVRIVAPIPGKNTVGIEVPNERRGFVKLGELASAASSRLEKMRIPLFLGKDVKGNPLAFDLAEMPHLLIAGRTGTGKSVCLNAMILSILMTRSPDEVKLLLIDPKMVELSQFKRVPHLMHPVVTDMKKAESLLAWACDKMDERYGYLSRAGVRNLQAYNSLGADEIYNRLRPEDDEEMRRIPTFMPYIVIIADEMADLMMTAAKEVESHIVRLAQKARAAGIHLILATQRPTVDVITGLIKGNMPARIAFQVTSRGDSRVILDEMGADKLLGMGDMLFLIPGTSHIVRAQGTYVSDGEVNRVCEYLEQYPVEFSKELLGLQVGGGGGPGGKDRAAALKERDDLYEPAIEVIIREGRGSTSLLQRALQIGYGRAARLIDFMAEDGIVGEFKSGTAREVLYSWEEWEALKNGDGAAGEAA